MLKLIDSVSLPNYIVLSLLLGLAPFLPEPHVVEKLKMLMNGELVRFIDIFDLLLHATPWILLLIKLTLVLKKNNNTTM